MKNSSRNRSLRCILKSFNIMVLIGLSPLFILSSCSGSVSPESEINAFGLVIHGGAGVRAREEMTPELEKQYRVALEKSLKAGYEILVSGGSSVEAVEAAIRVMEDSPLFNSGKGAAFTREGINELDASIMNGKTLRAGGLGAVRGVKNPISLARMVMEKTPHVLLVDQGALAFAKEMEVEIMPDEYFFTERQWNSLQRRLKEDVPYGGKLPPEERDSLGSGGTSDAGHFETVGAVALDKHGNLAAGTSTGGRVKKRPGRVGDSPIIGASTFANNKTCAVSTTGLGEKHMVLLTAKEISSLIDHKGIPLEDAVEDVIMNQLVSIGGEGGAISIDKNGNMAWAFTSNGMYRGYVKPDGKIIVRIYED
jgi:beta-aspartyl-peptidase (threonine type)